MVRILMICHGNICRSTMAEYVMRHLVAQRGLRDEVQVDSAATTRDALGWGVHEGTQRKLRAEGIACGGHRARQMTRADYDRYDYLIGMDRWNMRNMLRIVGRDPEGKLRPLLPDREVADPWYTGDFDATWNDVLEGCQALLDELRRSGRV